MLGRLCRAAWASPYLLLMLVALFWASNSVIGRAISTSIPPASFTFWRWLVAGSIMALFAMPAIRRQWPLLKQQWRLLAWLAFTGLAGFSLLFYVGLSATTAINSLMVQGAQPAITMMAMLAVHGERPGAAAAVGVLISLLGVAVIVSGGSLDALRVLSFNWGDGLIFAATLLYAIYSVLLLRQSGLEPMVFAAALFMLAALLALPVSLVEVAQVGGPRLDLNFIASILFVAIFSSCLAYVFYNRVVELAGPTGASSVTNIMPVFGSLLAAFFLGETIERFHLLGFALVFTGVMITRRGSARP